MAGSFTNYLELKLLDHLFGSTAYSVPTSLWLGLSTADPGEDGSGVAEPSGNAYARVEIENDTDAWEAAALDEGLGTKENKVDFTFAKATGAWGTITHFFLADQASGGNILASGSLTVAQEVITDNILKFPAGDLVITLD